MCRGTKFQNRHCTAGRRLPEANTSPLCWSPYNHSARHFLLWNDQVQKLQGYEDTGAAHGWWSPPLPASSLRETLKEVNCRANNDRKLYSCLNQVSYGIMPHAQHRDTAEPEILYLRKAEHILGIWKINDAGKDTLDMATLLNKKGPRANLWLPGQIL